MNILRVNNLRKSFNVEAGFFRKKTGTVPAVNDVSFALKKGGTLGIVGESGSGKTTLARLICGLYRADSGEILIDGKKIEAYGRRELAKKVQLIFQDPFASLNPKLSVGTMLREAAGENGGEGRIEEILKVVGLSGDILNLYPHQFSGGQRQRIAIARALLKDPSILVADEPLSSLDISIQNQMLRLFSELKKMSELTFIFISHDIVTTANFSDALIVMKDGAIVEGGNTRDVIEAPKESYTKKLLSSMPEPRFA